MIGPVPVHSFDKPKFEPIDWTDLAIGSALVVLGVAFIYFAVKPVKRKPLAVAK